MNPFDAPRARLPWIVKDKSEAGSQDNDFTQALPGEIRIFVERGDPARLLHASTAPGPGRVTRPLPTNSLSQCRRSYL